MDSGFNGHVRRLLRQCPDGIILGSVQIELLNRQSWKTVVELSTAMADYIETFYNPTRRHSSLAYLTPNEFEELHLKKAQAEFS